jgi:threonine synthase
MIFYETRGNDGVHPAEVAFSHAILNPIASYGGLYSPRDLPNLDKEFLRSHLGSNYKQLARALLELFAVDIEPAAIERAVQLYDGFDDPENPVPVVRLHEDLYVCELYHGPTRAFKDMALQPFGMLLSEIARQRNEQYLILAATSGDTGPAALETFKNRDNIRVVCLYPEGGTSDVQRLQMVTEDAHNLKVIGIRGNFDDAQQALKTLLASKPFKQRLAQQHISLSAANSVNFGRIIFQIIYHVHAYLDLVRQQAIELGDPIYLNVPSGNFGNALGGFYARLMGLPLDKILIASNANNVLTDLIQTGSYDLTRRDLINTSSPAMDILVSSNIERVLFALFGNQRTHQLMQLLKTERRYQLSADEHDRLKEFFAADSCSDDEVAANIKQVFDQGYLLDPHTATCLKAHATQRSTPRVSVIYSTAEWTKFSPMIDQALNGGDKRPDREALQTIAQAAQIEIPGVIRELFDKPIAQGDVIDKGDIEAEILKFLEA